MKTTDEAFERSKGLFNICVTPFTADGALNKEALATNMERVIGMGFDGVLIGGTYGEFPAMTTEERADLFRTAVDIAGDRVPLLLCSAASDPRVCRDLTTLASDLGGLPMVTAPYVSEVTEGHIQAYFKQMATHSKIGIMIYNAPGIGITLSPSLIEALSDIPGVVALKQGDLNPTTVDRIVGRVGGKIRVLAASDLAMLGPIATGFDGFSSTNSCALPEIIQGTYKALVSGQFDTARSLNQVWFPLRELCRAFGQPQTTKAMMDLRGWVGGPVRAPLLPLTETERATLTKTMATVAETAGPRALSLAA
ncbi:dihydrodipicolinate synthase family protein [Roseospira marina]|uniref:Dihydrodipicolinate synthase family protein n=1 Tax=Roseospira marina TaxID=140057 RepID=A0A5M6IER2_9PROT|nr:dihydrodipicolinate synthase family protein [Roseospira marina]KAA5606602.1 dihydrodipicolinate synthase family protein [Roseospira marina]MBB4313996.1 4-hydroxy-tetrahydrodipicolinate synthase [Roseospira marina]MBB5087158.1 4-hydroxy-tetrahydrodipicolinate synthase [Roseospira marina]